MINFTTFLAVDTEHLAELKTNWPSWMLFKPEILAQPLFVARDAGVMENDLAFLEHPNLRSQEWEYQGASQREKMLASFVLLAPQVVETPWFLKLDTDAVATGTSSEWCDEKWVQGNPVFVASPIAPTPPNIPLLFNKWANKIESLAGSPEVNIPLAGQDRITSWLFFGRTDWCQWAASLFGNKLPYPSHDLVLWYLAKRTRALFNRVDMSQFGWEHIRGRD